MAVKLYTVPEAAEFLRIPEETFRKKMKFIKRAKLGRRLIFTEDSLITYLESKTSKPKSELLKSAS